ncbi:MAG TPA: dihydrofolate reductase [Hyphomicrobiaceae bacterium]|nr:dihydrofolate reductase [Hyphomicrobiaceae bacterium]
MSAVIALVVAVAENGVIGAKGGLPWRMPSDLKTFRRLTMGRPVVMGRKTWESLARPLDGRDNIVVTRDPGFTAEGASVVGSLSDALTLARVLAATRGADEIMVIGGADIFREVLPLADRIYWTEVHAKPEGDAHFPPIEISEWEEVSREALARSPKDDYAATLKVLVRARASGVA